ncbi:MAG: CGNR zinc finger domain-containing protein [Xanthobacteraceae bacterium]|nr:CGNR zinc finger domain-containing protein [Xanthobacteraceae bacterium]
MKPTSASPETLAREELAIKFVNTVAWRLRDPTEDRLPSPEAMLKWMLTAKLLGRDAFDRIGIQWKSSPQEARKFFERAGELREAIYRLFVACIEGKEGHARDVATLNRGLAGASRGIGLAGVRRSLKWQLESDAAAESLLRPIAWSAAGLITGPRAERVKQCQDERGCGWLFIDESRAQNRRWCSMGDCGNLAKSRRHFHRVAATAASTRPAAGARGPRS